MAVLESAFAAPAVNLGFRLEMETSLPIEIALFEESPSRIILSVEEKHLAPGREIAGEYSLGLTRIGTTQSDWVEVEANNRVILRCRVQELFQAWQGGLETLLEAKASAARP